MTADDPLIKAMMIAKRRYHETALKKVCKRFSIPYADEDSEIERFAMFACIGVVLVQMAPEFKAKKRGRKPILLTDTVKLFQISEEMKSIAAYYGRKLTDADVARKLADVKTEATGQDSDHIRIAEQISRGRRKVRQLRPPLRRNRP